MIFMSQYPERMHTSFLTLEGIKCYPWWTQYTPKDPITKQRPNFVANHQTTHSCASICYRNIRYIVQAVTYLPICNYLCNSPSESGSKWIAVRPSVRTKQLGSHWTDFYEIWYLSVFFENLSRKFISDKNNLSFTRRPMYICDTISLNSS